jgi:hypothetical protein
MDLTKAIMSACLPRAIGEAKANEFCRHCRFRPVNGANATKPYFDECTQLRFSSFHTYKDEMVERSCELLHQWKHDGLRVEYVRCYIAGESKSLQKGVNGVD